MGLRSYSVSKLVSMVEKEKIVIPYFQREFVWSDQRVAHLADSIYKGYPIGVLIFYDGDDGKKYVLDGQQRLLSMVLLWRSRIRTKHGLREVLVWFNPWTEEFKASRQKPGNEWIVLSKVLSAKDPEELWELALGFVDTPEKAAKISKKFIKLWTVFTQKYEVPAYELPSEVSIDRLGEIFVRINFEGTRIRSADVMFTMLAIANERIAEEIRKFCTLLRHRKWDLDPGTIVRAFIAFLSGGKVKLANTVLNQANYLRNILDRRREELDELWRITQSSLLDTIELLKKYLNIETTRTGLIISQAPLIVVAYYIGKKGGLHRLSKEEITKLITWFLLASYYGRYSSATETKLNEDLGIVERNANCVALIDKLRSSIGMRLIFNTEDFRGFERRRLLLLYALLVWNNARDFYKPTVVNCWFAKHHIFPRAILLNYYNRKLIDDIANITFTSEETNKLLKDREPSQYLREIDRDILEKHLIPMDTSLWNRESYTQFLEERRKLIVNALNNYLSTYIKHR